MKHELAMAAHISSQLVFKSVAFEDGWISTAVGKELYRRRLLCVYMVETGVWVEGTHLYIDPSL